MPSLFVIRGNDQGMRFDLEAERVTVGRESTNTIQLHDREVSRGHAELIHDGRQFTIADVQLAVFALTALAVLAAGFLVVAAAVVLLEAFAFLAGAMPDAALVVFAVAFAIGFVAAAALLAGAVLAAAGAI